ncbi:MAG: hypothetical protein IJC84_02140 [Clostridia bacterium]|nr:hypothetical protein [Clostridia bacterium]
MTAWKRTVRGGAAVLWCVTLALLLWGCGSSAAGPETLPSATTAEPVLATVETAPQEIPERGYIASLLPEADYFDAKGQPTGTVLRGTEVEFLREEDGILLLLSEGERVYLGGAADVVSDPAEVVPAHTLYVRSTVNLRDGEGRLLAPLAKKGEAVEITGFDRLDEKGEVHAYRVRLGDKEGYILPWYLTDSEEQAASPYDKGHYATHAARGDLYGGGNGADLDYFPREKGPIEGNDMPAECRALYIAGRRISEVDAYLKIAESSGINAFVVDIADGGAIGYAGEVMKKSCPSAAAAAANTVETYRAAIQKLRDAGYYVIGRITTFNDTYFVKDHPEYAIANKSGAPLQLSGAYWPTAFSREAWQYKVDLAVEAVELMGFHEIQFDYVRFPDNTARFEKAGTIDFRNGYGETKAQAIQRFLMYATDILHEKGAYVSADVYGESAYTYVTAYGQYWAAISNVVDAISGMPYPDHFAASGDWRPWEHPYETLYNWGKSVMARQKETATPAVVRTWIQCYNAIRPPYNTYGPAQIASQIRGLRDSGCRGGFMTWNASSSLEKYAQIASAFAT